MDGFPLIRTSLERRLMRHRLLTAAVATSLALSLSPAVASAEPAPLTGVELNTTTANSVAVDATFDYAAAQNAGLPALKKLRGEMWDRNPYFNLDGKAGTTHLRDIATQYGLNTKEEYVNAVSVDNALTRIAVQRAVEASTKFDHKRPDGTSADTATFNGRSHFSENLGAGTALREAVYRLWGYGELNGLNNAGGSFYGGGHLHMLLDPRYHYFGFGEVTVPGTEYGTYTVAKASPDAFGGTALETGMQRAWLYRAPNPGEQPTGLKSGKPAPQAPVNPQPKPNQPSNPSNPSAGNNTDQSNGLNESGGGSSADLNKIIGIVFGILSLLGAIAGIAKQLGLI